MAESGAADQSCLVSNRGAAFGVPDVDPAGLVWESGPGVVIGSCTGYRPWRIQLLSNLFAGFRFRPIDPCGWVNSQNRRLSWLRHEDWSALNRAEALTSTLAIPNSIADDSMIVNFSDRARHAVSDHRQGVEIRMPLDRTMSSGQINQLIFFLNRHLE